MASAHARVWTVECGVHLDVPTVSAMNRIARAYVVRYRREAATACAAIATLLVVNTLTPLHSARIVVAAHSVPAGTVLRLGDLSVRSSTLQWSGTHRNPDDVVGRTTSRALSPGEPVTGASIMGASLLSGQVRGRVAVAVTVGTADATLVHAGDVVDVLSSSARVAAAASVIAVSASAGRGFGAEASATVVLAVYPREAEALAAARAAGPFTLALQQP